MNYDLGLLRELALKYGCGDATLGDIKRFFGAFDRLDKAMSDGGPLPEGWSPAVAGALRFATLGARIGEQQTEIADLKQELKATQLERDSFRDQASRAEDHVRTAASRMTEFDEQNRVKLDRMTKIAGTRFRRIIELEKALDAIGVAIDDAHTRGARASTRRE